MDFGSFFVWLEILGLLIFLITVLNFLFQIFVRKKSLQSALFGAEKADESPDADDMEQKKQAVQTSFKKTAIIAIFVVFNILFFYWVLEYTILFE